MLSVEQISFPFSGKIPEEWRMTQRVLTTRPALPGGGLDRLAAQSDLVRWDGEGKPEPAELHALAAGASGILCLGNDRVDAALLDAAGPSLRVVALASMGFDAWTGRRRPSAASWSPTPPAFSPRPPPTSPSPSSSWPAGASAPPATRWPPGSGTCSGWTTTWAWTSTAPRSAWSATARSDARWRAAPRASACAYCTTTRSHPTTDRSPRPWTCPPCSPRPTWSRCTSR